MESNISVVSFVEYPWSTWSVNGGNGVQCGNGDVAASERGSAYGFLQSPHFADAHCAFLHNTQLKKLNSRRGLTTRPTHGHQKAQSIAALYILVEA